MGYQWGKSPLGAAGWKARALEEEERATRFAAEIRRLQHELGDARTERNAARHEVEKANRSAWDAIERLAGKVERLRDRNARNAGRVRMLAGDLRAARTERNTARHDVEKAHQFALDAIKRAAGKMGRFRDRSERNAARVRMLAGDLRDARDALDEVGRIRQQWRTVLELRRRLDSRAARVEALARRAREYRTESRMLRDDLAWEREVSRTNIQQLERALAAAQARAVEAEEKAAAPAPPAPNVVAWEARVRDLEGALRDQQSITETWKREAGDARRAVTMLRSALNSARFNAAHTGSEAARVLEQTEEIDSRYIRKG